jgi:eukaryotic-like serine/threonine-protein kinase
VSASSTEPESSGDPVSGLGPRGAGPDRIGALVDERYEIMRLVGRGGMGAVYEASDRRLGRRVAIKLLSPEHAADPKRLARFRQEARVAASLEHENVVGLMDVGVAHDGSPYLVMEYLDGPNLRSLMGAVGRLPAPRAADLVIQACRGLEAAHAAGIVHRDLKPENLVVHRHADETDWLEIVDFGIAKLQTTEHDALTTTGTAVGTACYMAPEQARGDREVDPRTDVYALGAILYELLSGARVHPGGSYNATLYHVLTQPVRPLAEAAPDCPPGLCKIVRRALERDAGARFESVAALARALAPFARTEEGRAALGEGDATGAATIATAPPASNTARRLLPWLAVAIAVIAWVLLSRSGAREMPGATAIAAPSPVKTESAAPLLATALEPAPTPPLPTPAVAPEPVLREAHHGQPKAPGRAASPVPSSSRFDFDNPYE